MWTIFWLLVCIATNTIPRWINGITGDTYCTWQAISFVCAAIALKSFSLYIPSSRIVRIIFVFVDYIAMLALMNAIDEYFKVAQKLQPWEIPIAIILTIWTIVRLCTLPTKKAQGF